MRIFALSDIHVDYEPNARFVENLSRSDYINDVLILAGDVTDRLELLRWCLGALATRFRKVLFVPGNHDLWVARGARGQTSFQKFDEVQALIESVGASSGVYRVDGVSIIPLLGWYDYSFGTPSEELKSIWMDYHACRWPRGYGADEVSAHFAGLNSVNTENAGDMVITFSHFLPRLDLMPSYIPKSLAILNPVLGSDRLERQLRMLRPRFHIYGHSHVNRNIHIDGITYINNAFGYPRETVIAAKRLLCIHEF